MISSAVLALVLTLPLQSAEDLQKSGAQKLQYKDYDGAIEDCTRALKLDPKIWTALTVRAVALMTKGENEKALADLDNAIAINVREPYVYFNRGQLKHHLKDYDGAIADFTRMGVDREPITGVLFPLPHPLSPPRKPPRGRISPGSPPGSAFVCPMFHRGTGAPGVPIPG